MYPCTKFESIWKTSNFGTKFVQKNMTDKYFEKINAKIIISIQQCTHVQNLRHIVEEMCRGELSALIAQLMSKCL